MNPGQNRIPHFVALDSWGEERYVLENLVPVSAPAAVALAHPNRQNRVESSSA